MPAFDNPWVWVLAPVAVLALLRPAGEPIRYSSLAALPSDTASILVTWLLRVAGAGALIAVLAGLSGPHVPGETVERIGSGAEIVLLLDRSRSMDQPLQLRGQNVPMGAGAYGEPKGRVARRLLAELTAGRPQDRFALVVFSAFPMKVLDFADKPAAVQAAIHAGDIGRGLGDTDIGRALLAGLSSFEGRPYTGSRVVLLVSDGGAHLDDEMQREIAAAFKRHRASLYWIYIRSYNSPGLLDGREISAEAAQTIPEHFLHEFFRRLGSPYRAYEAEDPEAMKRAIADISNLQNFPLHTREVLPRRDLDRLCFAAALVLCLVLAVAAWFEVRRWT